VLNALLARSRCNECIGLSSQHFARPSSKLLNEFRLNFVLGRILTYVP
jgi:hypothetical protein